MDTNSTEYDQDEVKVTVILSRTYSFTTTAAAIKASLPGARVEPDVLVDDAADLVFSLLAADTMQRDLWVADIAQREGDLDDDSVSIEETSLA